VSLYGPKSAHWSQQRSTSRRTACVKDRLTQAMANKTAPHERMMARIFLEQLYNAYVRAVKMPEGAQFSSYNIQPFNGEHSQQARTTDRTSRHCLTRR
jgi:hypothetical protein